MLNLPDDFAKRLRNILLESHEFSEREDRNMLLQDLPSGPVSLLHRTSSPRTDLFNITNSAKAWGQLDSGEWALIVIANNAMPLIKGTKSGRDLENLLAELETSSLPNPLSPELINEILVWKQDERLPINFLVNGSIASKSVARVKVPRIINGVLHQGYGTGTGWLIAPTLLLTNHHVIEVRDRRNEPPATESDFEQQALKAVSWFGYIAQGQEYEEYTCIELIHANVELDYALLRLPTHSLLNKPLMDWGCLSIAAPDVEIPRGSRLNIVQHPQGRPQCVAIRNNFYVDNVPKSTLPNRIRYLTDTEPGSSGSPVFNDQWQVVALHHASVKIPQSQQYRGEVIRYHNQGIDIHAILKHLPENIRQEILN